MRSITKRFPGVLANDSVDFDALEGEVHALLGENGAGKPTPASLLTGLHRSAAGQVTIFGRAVDFHSPRDAVLAGVGMVHQPFRLAASLTVADNIVLGHQGEGWLRTSRKALEESVADLSKRYRMPVNPRARIWQLSVGEQQRVEILKALYRGARILILDEPTALLTPQESDDLFETLRRMKDEGRTVVFVSHKLEEVMSITDRVTVLRAGKVVGTVQTSETNPRDLARMMVGREVVFRQSKPEHDPAGSEVVLEVDDLCGEVDLGMEAVHNVWFRLHKGEVLAVAGVSGNGQRELAELLAGMRPLTNGAVIVRGRRLRGGGAAHAIKLGIAYIAQDRIHTRVRANLSIADNLILKSHRRAPMSYRGWLLRHGAIRTHANDLITRFNIAAPGPDTPTRLLSGGNVQKVGLARELSIRPKVIVAANPP